MFCKNSVAWLYRSERSFVWDSGLRVDEDRVFRDADGKVRLIIEASGRITVTRHYSWNGCSPKMCVFDFIVGTPDGVVHARTGRPKTYFASMVHDALDQFLRANSPLSRRQADACFLRLMAESDFALRYVYWAAVRVFGRLVWRAKRASRGWRGTGVPVSALLGPAQSLRGTPGTGDPGRA
jgi:hypothetical protein